MRFVIAALAGVILGIAYFGGLWLTIQRMSRSSRPTLLLASSFVVRLLLVLVGFYLLADGRFELLAVSLVTFFLTRFYFIRRIQPDSKRRVDSYGNQS